MGRQLKWVLFLALFASACLSACTKTTDVKVQISAQLAKDDAVITGYLKNNHITANEVDSVGVSTGTGVPTGIYYTIDTLGTGNELFTSSTEVTVGYTGRQLAADGTLGSVFVTTDKFHPSYVLGELLRGWQLGLPKDQVGGTITLYLPSHYAYGPYVQSDYNLPANAILVFQIKLYNVTN